MTRISELSAALGKVQQVAGDVPVILRDAESGAETVLLSLGINLDPSGDLAGGNVVFEHGQSAPVPEPAPPAPDPAPPAA